MTDAPKHPTGAPLWGVSAEFGTPEAMLAALIGLRDLGLGRLDAFSPFPVAGAAEALRLPRKHTRIVGMAAAMAGAAAMFALCTYATIWGYRFNIGGRPLFSWPSFVIPSISFGALTGAATVFFVVMSLNRLPRLNHPAFNIQDFTRVTADRFFVAVEARDDRFDADAVEIAIGRLPIRPLAVRRVPR